MARRRFQEPKPIRYGKYWVVQVRGDRMEDGQRRRYKYRIQLCSTEQNLREAQRIAAEKLRPVNQGLERIGAAITTFEDYVTSTYTSELNTLGRTTQGRYAGVLKNYLLPQFGKLPLSRITRKEIQKFFAQPSTLSHESLDKIRDVLSSVLECAVQNGDLVLNPARNIRLPRDKRGRRAKPHVTPEQFEQLLSAIAEPYATMLFVAVYTGLRISELTALKWEDIHADSITIDERYCRGEFAQPKTAASNATIGVDRSVIERIHRLKLLSIEVRAGVTPPRRYQLVKSDGPGDLVFQSVRDGKPMRDNNILTRFIKPAARALGIPWVNWRCLRTSHATWLVEAGANPKDVQGQMRHSRISTTMDVYAQFVPESQREAIAKMSVMAGERRATVASSMKQLNLGGTNWLQ